MIMVLTMPASTSSGMNLERSLYPLPSLFSIVTYIYHAVLHISSPVYTVARAMLWSIYL